MRAPVRGLLSWTVNVTFPGARTRPHQTGAEQSLSESTALPFCLRPVKLSAVIGNVMNGSAAAPPIREVPAVHENAPLCIELPQEFLTPQPLRVDSDIPTRTTPAPGEVRGRWRSANLAPYTLSEVLMALVLYRAYFLCTRRGQPPRGAAHKNPRRCGRCATGLMHRPRPVPYVAPEERERPAPPSGPARGFGGDARGAGRSARTS